MFSNPKMTFQCNNKTMLFFTYIITLIIHILKSNSNKNNNIIKKIENKAMKNKVEVAPILPLHHLVQAQIVVKILIPIVILLLVNLQNQKTIIKIIQNLRKRRMKIKRNSQKVKEAEEVQQKAERAYWRNKKEEKIIKEKDKKLLINNNRYNNHSYCLNSIIRLNSIMQIFNK